MSIQAALHNTISGRISRLGAKFYAKAAGTPTSLGLELNPSKSALGFDFILLYLVLLGGLGEPEHRLTLCLSFCLCVTVKHP